MNTTVVLWSVIFFLASIIVMMAFVIDVLHKQKMDFKQKADHWLEQYLILEIRGGK